jgi:hypothetical protein
MAACAAPDCSAEQRAKEADGAPPTATSRWRASRHKAAVALRSTEWLPARPSRSHGSDRRARSDARTIYWMVALFDGENTKSTAMSASAKKPFLVPM